MANTKTLLTCAGTCSCVLLILVLTACGKKNQPNPDPPTGGEKPVNLTTLVPQKLEQPQLQISLSYGKIAGQLISLAQSDGLSEKLAYNDQQRLKRYERYQKSELIYLVDYTWDDTGKVIRASQHLVELNGKSTTPLGYYDVELNAASNISSVKWYNLNDQLLKTVIYNYSESGTVNTVVNTSPDIKPTGYTYDDKNGLFKKVSSCQFLALENNLSLLRSEKSNVIRQTGASLPYTYNYTYNKEGYPVTITSFDEKGAQTSWKVTY
ncbi:hypothetical protein [Pedobacter duraquae]|uniref:YD repeat-containing protein n=1 Tax=Pedobacter duraquae TaxID=425511 RepID=A0A4R6IL23_9SPHI|nr:hypothetical protein [Pedobacter duraquae]TDO22767.1 hypothetical protein CLV32_1752 [Pedobacter duraquae]